MPPLGLLNLDRQYQKLAEKKDFLIRLNTIVSWKTFYPLIAASGRNRLLALSVDYSHKLKPTYRVISGYSHKLLEKIRKK